MHINILEFIVKILSVLIPLSIATIYAFKDFKKRNGKLKGVGYFVVILLCITIPLAIWDYFNSINQQYESEQKADDKARERDSINLVKNAKADSLLYNAFAKYGLKYDKAEQKISKLISDSSKVTIISKEKPYLYISNIVAETNADKVAVFKIYYTSAMAPSLNVKILLDVIQYDNESKIFKFLTKNLESLRLGTDIAINESNVEKIQAKNYSETYMYLFNVHGTYEVSDGKELKINKTWAYDFKEDKDGNFGEPSKSLIIPYNEFIKNNK